MKNSDNKTPVTYKLFQDNGVEMIEVLSSNHKLTIKQGDNHIIINHESLNEFVKQLRYAKDLDIDIG